MMSVDESDAVATVAGSGDGVTPPNLAAWEEFKRRGSERVANLFGSLRLFAALLLVASSVLQKGKYMSLLPHYRIQVFDTDSSLPAEAEELFREELTGSRTPLSEDRPDRDQWEFRMICAVDDSDHVLGGVHFDLGPRTFGPLATDRVAVIEHGIVREQNRRHGLGTTLLQNAIEVAREEDCQCMRCNVSWANEAEMALFKKCGFALACIDDGEYFAAKPLQGYSCNE